MSQKSKGGKKARDGEVSVGGNELEEWSSRQGKCWSKEERVSVVASGGVFLVHVSI